MEGLEAVEIQKSEINSEARYEAEFFLKRFVNEDKALSSLPQRKIGEFAIVTDGPHGYHVVDESSQIVMLTAKNAAGWFANREGADPIAEAIDLRNRRSSLQIGDVILSTRGTVGKCALVTQEVLPANIDQDVARISWGNHDEFIPEFVIAYLNSSYGQDHISRHSSGMVQQGVSLQKVREIPLPCLSLPFQRAITATVTSALEQQRGSKSLYTQAENTLLDALGLRDWQPPQPLTYESRASAAFAAGRLDAEHFQPHYGALLELLKAKGAFRLGDRLMEPLRRGISPEYVDDGDVIVVNSQHVGKSQVEVENNRTTSEAILNLPAEGRGRLQRGDVLLNSTGNVTIGRCQCLLENINAVADNHVAIIRPDQNVDPVYLACFLNTQPGQMQTESNWTGSSGQIELRPDVIADYLIWDAPPELQKEIRSHIEASHTARRRAKSLLEAAKRAVEIAIEGDEAAALGYLGEE